MDAATTAGSAASAAESLPCSDAPLEVQLFYRYVQLPDPEAVVTQLRCLCEELGLSGRMRIASEGINGILCGKPEQLARYREAMRQPGSPLEGLEVQYKLSAAGAPPPPTTAAHHRRSPPPLTTAAHHRHSPPPVHHRRSPPPLTTAAHHRRSPPPLTTAARATATLSLHAIATPPPSLLHDPCRCLHPGCLAIAGDDGDPMGGELYVRVCDELTATGDAVKDHLPTVLGGAGGTHLCAQAFHEALTGPPNPNPKLTGPPGGGGALATDRATKEGRRRVVIDTRNHFETAVGR